MSKNKTVRWVVLVALAALLAGGCAKKPAPVVTEVPPAPAPVAPVATEEMSGLEEQGIAEAPITEAAPAPVALPGLQRIHFAFDQYVLTDAAREVLAGNAAYLKANGSVQVKIEGHCDERGSDEYNLALGERRALAAKNYLVSLGVASSRLDIISYGEEVPLDPRGTEEAFSKNRRAEFKAAR